MKIAEILKLEQNNTENIILHHEGLFWRAYEWSAFRFVKHLKPYQITKKHIKSVKTDIVYCGFPQNALNQALKGRNITTQGIAL